MSHFDLKNESLAELKFDPIFKVKMTPFFCFVHERKIESFDLKKSITGRTKI